LQSHYPFIVLFRYLFNPFTLFVCLAKSSALFTSAASLAAIFFALQRRKILAMAAASLAAYFSIYSVSLAIPAAILACQHPQRKLRRFASAAALFIGWFVTWHCTTMLMTGSWSYLHTTIGCNLHVADLRPNIGLAWYLFVEMFDHFRSFFLAIFQLHHGIYITPATIKFRRDPLMLAFFFTAVSSVFKPYPTIADTVLLLAFLAFLGGSLLSRAKTLPVYIFALCLASLLGPINWHYWIRQGSGNANFFYAVVLLYNGSTIVMVLDVIKQWVGRELERANPGITLDKVYQR
jgi:phosphatidylinositol glycan class U